MGGDPGVTDVHGERQKQNKDGSGKKVAGEGGKFPLDFLPGFITIFLLLKARPEMALASGQENGRFPAPSRTPFPHRRFSLFPLRMASIERTAYPRFTKRMSAEELCACYELSDAALDFVGANANGDRQRLTLAVLLKTRQQLGVYIRSNAISGDLKLNNANMGDLRIFDTPSNRSTWGQDIWGEDSVLDLAGAMVVSLDNDVELRSWPARISSLGFNFQRVVGRVAESEADRSIDWWNEWLKRVTYGYSGTAKAAAKSLRDAGEPDSADDLLYDYRVREQQPLAGSVMLG